MYVLQAEDTRGFFTKLLHFCIGNWEKALILGILITLIVLVSVKVTYFTHSLIHFALLHNENPAAAPPRTHTSAMLIQSSLHIFSLLNDTVKLLATTKIDQCLPLLQGFSIFGTMLGWFEKQNNWKGWAVFLPVYTVNVALFLPGVIFILAAGFIFGSVPLTSCLPHEQWMTKLVQPA